MKLIVSNAHQRKAPFVSGNTMTGIKTYTIFILTIVWALNSLGQKVTKDIKVGGFELQSSTVDSSINALYCSIGQMPEFPGGLDSLLLYAKNTLYYPKSAIKDSIEGKVVLQFIVDTDGKVINEKIFKSVRTDLDTICLSMVRQMPTWKAGRLEEKAIAVKFTWPITFVLTKGKKN